jgi:hypothetical protein
MKSSPTRIGRAGEFIVAGKMTLAGFDVFHVSDRYDLLVCTPSERMIRVEVKSSSSCETSRKYKFYIGNISHCDIVALFTCDRMAVRLLTISDLPKRATLRVPERATLRVPCEFFSNDAETSDMERLLQT